MESPSLFKMTLEARPPSVRVVVVLGFGTITPSVALAMNIYDPNTRGIALLQNGTLPAAGAGAFSPIAPVLVGGNANPIQVTVTYSGGGGNFNLQRYRHRRHLYHKLHGEYSDYPGNRFGLYRLHRSGWRRGFHTGNLEL